jgi:hypothetical protein
VCSSPRPSRRTSRTAFAAEPPDPDDPLLSFAPYLHKQPRSNAITPERQRAFIAMLAATGIVTQAARHIGASLEALYKLRHRPGAEGFSVAWDMAIDRGLTRLEDCAVELAVRGEELPIVSAGKLLGTFRKHNFGHIRFVLQQRRRERWGAEPGGFAALRPGHPVYERLRREWAEEERQARAANSEEVILSINAKLQQMCERRILAGEMEPTPAEAVRLFGPGSARAEGSADETAAAE